MPASRWLLPVLAAAALLTSDTLAQDKPKIEPEPIQFESGDGVQLQGSFYKAVMTGTDRIVTAKAESDAPVVIMLHPFLGDPNAKEWDGLAVVLASRGFHVLRFDFRGHGKSTIISKNFWDSTLYPENTKVFPPAKNKPLPQKLENSQLKNEKGYWPVMVNDILAARVAVDKMSDKGKLNATSVYLLAVGDACPLAMMYMAAEWMRPQKPTEDQAKYIRFLPPPQPLMPAPRDSAGKDIAAAIFVAPTYPPTIPERSIKDWVKLFPDMRDSNAILCIHGDGDAAGKKFSSNLVDDIFIANPKPPAKVNKLTFTLSRPIKGSKLTGVDLLNPTKSPDTEKEILNYLTAVEKDRKTLTPVNNRNYNDAPYLSPQTATFPALLVR